MRSRYLLCNQAMVEVLAASREAAGISQRALSAKLKRPHNYVYLIEKGERPLNVCEFIEIGLLIRNDPAELIDRIVKASGQKRRRR